MAAEVARPVTVWAQRVRQTIRKDDPTPLAPPDTYPVDEIAAMLRTLGVSMLEVGLPTNLVNARILTVAAAYTTKTVRCAVLSTMLMVQIDEARTTEIQESTRATTRLDEAGQVDDVFHLAGYGAIAPVDAVAALQAARQQPPRFGAGTTVFGYVLATVGFGTVIHPTWGSLPCYALLGTVVGLVLLLGRRLPQLVPIQSVVAALIVTVLGSWFVADVADSELLRVITPALIAILPGISLTTGAVELASGEMIAGASRVVYGVAQLMLMASGVLLGIRLAGPVPPQPPAVLMGDWALYVGVLALTCGLYLFLSAPRRSLIWLVAAMSVALSAQDVATKFLHPALAGAVGAFVVIPFAMLASRLRTAPPGTVMALIAFWGLVPGALSFIRFSEAATGGPENFNTLLDTVAAIFGIALGSLIGWSVFSAYTVARQRRRVVDL